MFKNKKILLVCKETYSNPLYYLAKKLAENNKVAAFFILSEECSLNKCRYNKRTYYKFIEELKNVEIFDVKDICNEFEENFNNILINKKYINMIEDQYTHYRNLNLQLISSQFTTRSFHNRFYMKNTNFKQNLYWIQLNYKKAIAVIDNFKPDIILDLDNAELQRTVLNEIAYKKQIPYITLEHPRYDEYKIPTFNMGIETEEFFKEAYIRNFNKNPEELKNSYEYIYKYRNEQSIMPKEYKNSVTSKYNKDSLTTAVRRIGSTVKLMWDMDITNKNFKIKNKNKHSIVYSNSINYIKFISYVEMKKQVLFKKNKYFVSPNLEDRYVYMPLHLIPESTTFVKAPYFIDEKNIIEQVSKSLPIGWKLYVKEHQAMLGERSLKFYKEIAKLPNVKVVQFNHYKDPKPWIENAEGVITITGTGAYEAALLGKKAIIFGDVPFELIEGVTKINSPKDLNRLIKEFGTIDNIHSCAAYIEAVKEVGYRVRLKYLIDEGGRLLYTDDEMNEEYSTELNNLIEFYERAYYIYSLKEGNIE